MTKENSSRFRTTISLDKEVHDVFVKMSEVSGLSISRCMGDWLSDTVEGALFVTQKMQDARNSPRAVMAELHSMAQGLNDLTKDVDTLLENDISSLLKTKKVVKSVRKSSAKTPSSNTGLNSPSK